MYGVLVTLYSVTSEAEHEKRAQYCHESSIDNENYRDDIKPPLSIAVLMIK